MLTGGSKMDPNNLTSSESWDLTENTHPKTRLEIKPCSVEYARSRYSNWSPPLPINDERTALGQLIHEWIRNPHMDSQGDAEQPLVVIDLSDFEIYRSPGPERNEYELTSLHHFDIKTRNLQLSGVLTLGNARHFVDQVRIETYSIQGYNVDDDPNTVVYVRSHQASRDPTFDVWFRLGKSCARSYRRFHEPFVWVADLGKHVIDYISSKGNSSVGLDDFRSSFFQWLHRRYQNSAHFSSWIGAYEKRDFRIPVNAYIDYLYGQAYNLPNSKQLLKHNLWAECSKGEGRAIQNQPIICEHTIATPLVYRCFRGMYFGKFLAEKEPRQAIRERQETRKTSLGFAVDSPGAEFLAPNHPLPPLTTSLDFEVGDVVSVNREKGIWKTHDEEWLGYIQRIETLPKAGLRLFLIWLYRPTDTPIDSMVYPISKEMFLSDHCNCDEAPIHSTDVIRKYAVDWNPKNLHTEKDVLVRQKYVIEDKAWITLKASDYECDCMRSKERRSISYQPGDCVYIKKSHQGRPSLEPVVISRVCETSDEIIVRQLLRASRDCSNISSSFRRHTAAANEVVWTNEHFKVRTHHIERKCHIRFFLLEDVVSCRVPTPYDRGGNGDFWYLSTAVTIVNSKKCLSALGEAPSPMVQGFDPASTPWTPLRALSLFSGGGNLDRGLEDGGAVRFQNAVDISEGAILTQRANATHVKDLDLYWGSVDDYLKAVLKGKTNSGIARIGDIQFIAAGSPCPGFSRMQPDWQSASSLRNASHITTFASFVDTFRPEYALLENVVSMADKRKGFEEEKVFHQLIACLVGLGYQVHHYLIDAWTYGSPQQRSRIFISIAAPGLEPIAKPFMTHSHPSSINRRSLGTLVNGESFGCREEYATPFEYVTAGQATSDLPKIGSGLVQACTSFPDHRILRNMNGKDRALTRCIPVSPPGQGYLDALKLCRIPDSLLKTKQNPGRAFTRIKEASLFPTITTTVSPQDSRWGHVLHWNEHRPISLMEARRAQGIPDHEVIVGSLTEQWRIIGNAVERNVALALGLSLRRAWEASSGGSAQVQVNGEFLAKQEFKDTVEVIDLCSDNEYTPLDSDIIMSDAVINAKDSALDDAYPTGTRASPVLIPSPTRSPSPHISKMRPRKNPQADQRSGAVGKKRKRQSRLLTFAEFMPERWDTVPENYLKGVI